MLGGFLMGGCVKRCPKCGSENVLLSPNCLRGDCEKCGLSWLADRTGITSYYRIEESFGDWVDVPDGTLPILREQNERNA
jgi:hypothetical protein